MEQTYFEAGKIVSNSFRAFLLSGVVLITFLLDSGASELKVPFINLNLSYQYALVTMYFIHASFFYRYLSAINYERELRERVRIANDNLTEKVWLLSYPSLTNFHQFSGSMMSRNNHKILESLSVIQLLLLGIVLPAWSAIKLLALNLGIDNWSLSVLFLNAVCSTLVVLTCLGLMNPNLARDNKQKQADA
jgi:ABC-type multidrug transport system fused ATPase/permease subunit